MIVFIEGKLLSKEPNRIVINVKGIGYECNISSFTYDRLPDLDKEVSLHTYLNISENNHSLFGFLNIDEKNLFKMLIGVNGIGPKTAMPVLSAAKPEPEDTSIPSVPDEFWIPMVASWVPIKEL